MGRYIVVLPSVTGESGRRLPVLRQILRETIATERFSEPVQPSITLKRRAASRISGCPLPRESAILDDMPRVHRLSDEEWEEIEAAERSREVIHTYRQLFGPERGDRNLPSDDRSTGLR